MLILITANKWEAVLEEQVHPVVKTLLFLMTLVYSRMIMAPYIVLKGFDSGLMNPEMKSNASMACSIVNLALHRFGE